jgi:alkanesulfonate monooxygenase SsuD/methylene tetrahydromethanopterin reductase-like flavin-dependent oxidoreductase (luciferase family)
MMIGCVVGRDARELDRRLGEFREVTGGDRPPIAGSVDEVVAQLREYENVGVGRVMLQHLVHEDTEMVTVLGEVAARLT